MNFSLQALASVEVYNCSKENSNFELVKIKIVNNKLSSKESYIRENHDIDNLYMLPVMNLVKNKNEKEKKQRTMKKTEEKLRKNEEQIKNNCQAK